MTLLNTIFIDGLPVDPQLVIAPADYRGSVTCRIEVCLPLDVVLHELQESSNPSLTAEKLRDFLAADAKDYRSREAYLVFARAVAGIPSSEKQNGPFRWAWTDTTEVAEDATTMRLKGTAIALIQDYEKGIAEQAGSIGLSPTAKP